MPEMEFPINVPAIRVQQPLGEFFVVSLPAYLLRQIVYLDPTRITRVDRSILSYLLGGAQRPSSKRRAKEIAEYINTTEAAFPNSIILAANYNNDGELQEKEPEEGEDKAWRVDKVKEGFVLHIPSAEKMASVIDGQHRLLGFDFCSPERKSMELLCAVYMGLPHAYQAYLFATININQRKVDKSLAYDQFGYNLDVESKDGWSPDKLAVYLTRKMNLDVQSPFYKSVKVAPLNSEILFPGEEVAVSKISTAALVEGISRLISESPKKDRDQLHKTLVHSRKRGLLTLDSSPLRKMYLEGRDQEIYNLILSYFKVAQRILWAHASVKSFIQKTLGIQALLDVLRIYLGELKAIPNESEMENLLNPVKNVDFADSAFQGSGRGRVRIKNLILLYAGLITPAALPEADQATYAELIQQYPRA